MSGLLLLLLLLREREKAMLVCTRALSQSAYVNICQHTSAYVSICQHTSAYVSISQLLLPPPRGRQLRGDAGLYTCILEVSPATKYAAAINYNFSSYELIRSY